MEFTDSELKIIKECVKAHPEGYRILYSDNQYDIIKMCVEGHPKSRDIINKLENIEYDIKVPDK